MTVLTLTAAPDGELAPRLEEFERQFRYPLGPSRTFRVSHGRCYLPFFQAMGETRLLVATRDEEVLGTLAIVTRRLVERPNSADVGGSTAAARTTARAKPIHYLCDLKVHPEARGGPVLASLFRRAGEIVRATGSVACYSVVMQGTGRLPVEYTGRLGVPRFEPAGRLAILRLTPRPDSRSTAADCRRISADELAAAFERLAAPRLSAEGGARLLRSEMTPVGLIDRSGAACGLLEDTLLGKRLFTDSDEELRSAHLSYLAWSDSQAAARLLEAATHTARISGYPALFACLPEPRLSEILPLLRHIETLVAPAQIFSHAVSPTDLPWWINTSEI